MRHSSATLIAVFHAVKPARLNLRYFPQHGVRGHHMCDGAVRRGHRGSHHTPVSPEDRTSRPSGVRRQHAGLGHLHLPHLRGGQEEHHWSLRKARSLELSHRQRCACSGSSLSKELCQVWGCWKSILHFQG